MGFHDKTRLKSKNYKMKLAIPLDRVDIYLSSLIRIFLSYLALILHSIKSI